MLKRIYVGQEQLISFDGRLFKDTDGSSLAVSNLIWAQQVLANPAETYPNGKHSHEVANEIVEQSEDILIDYQRFVA